MLKYLHIVKAAQEQTICIVVFAPVETLVQYTTETDNVSPLQQLKQLTTKNTKLQI